MPGIGGIEAASRIASHELPPVVLLVTGATLPLGVPAGTAAQILAKHQLNPTSLQRAWEAHAPNEARTPSSHPPRRTTAAAQS